MRMTAFAIVFAAAALACGAPSNPCTNGSFERLDADGFPVDWEAVGETVGVSADAHSGKRSLRLHRAADAETPETGLNRGWEPDSGQRGAMIDRLKGGIDFWYKAIAAEGATLRIYAIAMTKTPLEKTGERRAAFVVPVQHVGDGQWHHARLKYDFTENEKAKWVHFSARIVGTAGELLLDDVSYIERVGALLRIGKIRLDEDPTAPGRRCMLNVEVENAGDVATPDVRLSVDLPDGLTATPAVVSLDAMQPDDKAWAKVTVDGARTAACTFGLTATAGKVTALASYAVEPALEIENFGPTSPVATVGEPVTFECVLRNPSHVMVTHPVAEFGFPSGTATATGKPIAPGGRAVLRASFRPTHQTPALRVPVRVTAGDGTQDATLATTLVVGAATRLPRPAGRLRADSGEALALLENAHVRLAFRRNEFGFGPGELMARTPRGWRTVAWVPRLSRIVHRYASGVRHESEVWASAPPQMLRDGHAGLRFWWTATDAEGGNWWFQATFLLGWDERSVKAIYQLGCDQPRDLLAFDGPMLYALERDEALFPGLEWLVPGEVSSSDIDIAAKHPHRLRYVVHPNMVTIPAIAMRSRHGVVGLAWCVGQKWDGTLDRPSVAFASPDRFRHQRAHLAGLFVPTVPDYVAPNSREAATPYPLKPTQPLRLRCRMLADGHSQDVLAAMDLWLSRHGIPDPAPLPHKTYEAEIQFSMQGYLKGLWEPETKEWWSSKGGNPLMCKTGRQRSYVADVLLGAMLSPDPKVRQQCRARADEVLKLIGGEPRHDAQRYGTPADLRFASPGRAAAGLASMGKDGAWRFDADRKDQGVFKGRDYHELGPDNAVELGTCARKAFEVLRYARIAGDWTAYERMDKTLRLMETFAVPRAAQVWEVPVHTPDILAAADAVDAYIEAYRFSGNKRWLRNAVLWARRGIPFVYLWNDPDKPFLVGATIPVFGASWDFCSWFGRPVQWNGLRYANALLKLAEFDNSYAWRKLAEGIIRSGIHQQDTEGDNVGLWPDNISALDSRKCGWVFAPRHIIRNVLKLIGRDEDPATVILGKGRQRLHVSAAAPITDTAWDGTALIFKVTYPRGDQGVVLVSNVAKPTAVHLDGKPIAERSEIETGAEAGWRYGAANAYLAIRVPRDGASLIRIAGARFRHVERLPQLVRTIAFDFDGSPDGFVAAHHVADLTVRDGALAGRITGGDPYVIRGLMRVPGDSCPVVHIRMRLTGGQVGQFFFTTKSSSVFAENKKLVFDVKADGKWHDYRIDAAAHPLWKGGTITAIRLDPGNGAADAEFAIDYIRGARQ